MHTLSVMHSMNLRCPYDLGVCGPDDWGWNRQMNWSELIGDGITTFVIHPYEIGKAAGELIIERLENPDGEKKMLHHPDRYCLSEFHSAQKRGLIPK